MKLGFIGVGEIATCLISGLKNHEICGSSRSEIKNSKVKSLDNNTDVFKHSEIVFLAVKPQDMDEVLTEIKDSVEDHIVISVAAAISMDHIAEKLGEKKLVRLHPNIPAKINEIAAGYSTRNLTEEDEEKLKQLFKPLGTVLPVDESNIDFIGLFSGSGPAFVAKLVQDYIQAGMKHGLSEEVAKKLAIQTFLGTLKLLQTMDPKELVDQVSSPGGITVEAIKELEVEEIFNKTFKRGLERTKELG